VHPLTVHTSHPALEDGTDTRFRNVGLPKFDAGEIPKRIHTILKRVKYGQTAPSTFLKLLSPRHMTKPSKPPTFCHLKISHKQLITCYTYLTKIIPYNISIFYDRISKLGSPQKPKNLVQLVGV
jgi:hypothetical protein